MINDNDKYSKNDDIFSHDIRHIFAQQTAQENIPRFQKRSITKIQSWKNKKREGMRYFFGCKEVESAEYRLLRMIND